MPDLWNVSIATVTTDLETSASKLWDGIVAWWGSALPALINAAIVIALGFWLTRILTNILRKALKRGKGDVGVQQFTVSLVNTILKGLVLLTALSSLGVNVTSIVAALGAAGVTAGLAIKDSLANFVSGVTLLYTRPFRVGDYISFDGNTGTVQAVQLMSTTICTLENKRIVIPNAHLTSRPVTNFTAEDLRRAEFAVTAASHDDAEQAMSILESVLSENEKTSAQPPVQILITGVDRQGVHVSAYAWCDTEVLNRYQHEVWKNVQEKFEKAGLLWPRDRVDINILQKANHSMPAID